MKSKITIILSILLTGFDLAAQTIITGTVTDIYNYPIPFANVCLLETSVETTTDKDGKYQLKIPESGEYKFFVSCLGFESNLQYIAAIGNNLNLDIQLTASFVKLRDNKVTSSIQERKKYNDLFIKLFLGETLNASNCKILNIYELRLVEDSETHFITGYSTRPLRIENKALGYTIIYDLEYFSFNPESFIFKFAGNYFFMPYKGKSRNIKSWNRNRMAAYKGSRMHFIRSLYSESLEKENFEIYESDSINNDFSAKCLKPLSYSDIIIQHDKFSKTFYYKKPLTIIYNQRPVKLVNVPSEYLTYDNKSNLILIDSVNIYQNGTLNPSSSLKWEGDMFNARVADLLPFDYQPIEIKKTKLNNVPKSQQNILSND